MAQEIDITGLKKNFNTTVVGDSVVVITQYAVRTFYNRQYYANSRVYEFNNRPVDAVNYLTFETPLVVARSSTRLILSSTATNNTILVTGQAIQRAGTSTQVNISNTASLFVKGSIPMRLPINMYSGGVGTINTFTAITGQPNIYGVAAAGTGTWAFAIEQLPPTQVAGLSINSIITVNTSSNSTGNFGSGNTAYVQAINSNQIIVVASGGTTPVNGTIIGITPTGGTATPSQTGYTVHIFTSNGNFVPTSSVVADILIVGGGGAGGFGHGAGGGGGAVIYGSSKSISSGTYAVVVGQGGAQSTSNASNNPGGSSSIFGITATGGGAGANEPGDDTSGRAGTGSPGANGGGGGYGGAAGGVGTAPAAAGYSVYAGNAGAAGYSVANFNYGMGGGGGAGGTPTQPSILLGGAGGNGVQIGAITDGVNNYYWGGGGGGTTFGNSNSGTGGSGGLGGGGGATVFGAGAPYPTAGLGGGSAYNSGAAGSVADSGTGGAGGANTGGGGGGGSNENGIGGAGGSGIVVVRYIGSQKATGGIISSVNSAITIPTFRDPIPVGWEFTITNLASTVGYNIGDVISHVPRTGRLGSTSSLVYLTGISTGTNSISGISFGNTPPLLGNINAVYSTGESLATTVVSNVSTSSPYTFVVSGLTSTSGLIAGSPGSIITATNSSGSFGAGNVVVVQAILGYTSLLAYVTSGSSVPVAGSVTNFTATGATATTPVVGQVAYTTTGTYSWTAPAGVTSVSVVAVGGGGGGSTVWSGGGGGGGGLGWKNNISVTPGQTYTVVVGAGGPPSANATNAAAAGGTSYFISTATVAGYGGGLGGPNSTAFGGGYGGGYLGDSGGRGGNGAFQGSWTSAGAGAAGYSGNGADSGPSAGTAAPVGSGAGAAGGYYSSTQGTPAGGGVGILGRGADGTASGQFAGGGGGSGGEQGRGGEASGQQGPSIINGGAFGGGGGGSGTSYGGGWGGRGAVRIIWGTGRSFPVTQTADVGTIVLPTIVTSFKNENVGGSSFVYPSSRIESIPLVLQQNNVPRIAPVEIRDTRRLVLQRQIISKTGSEFSLRNNLTSVQIAIATNSQQFSTGTLSFIMPLTTNPGGVGFIGTVTQLPILPNIYGVALASAGNWAFAVENVASTQTSSLSFGRIVTASTSPTSTGNFGSGNTVWVFSTATSGVVVLIASGGSTPPTAGSINGLTITGGIYNPPLNTNVDLLLVGGGGSGGNHNTTNANGGGGAGGLLYGTNINLSIGSYAVVIGQGGAAVPNATAGNGNKGTSSTFGTVYIAHGGGGGVSSGVAYNAVVNNGGSGGGFAQANGGGGGPGLATQTSQGGATGYGNAGGGNAQGWTGAGGGGAGSAGVGGSGGTAPAGDGGRGRAYDISGTWQWYAGGGGGGGNSSERAGDGYAGGGRGAGQTTQYAYNSYPAQSVNAVTTGSSTPNAIPNTGGGGGGGSYWAPNGGWGSGSGAGGSGIAIVRYLGAQAGSGGIITSANGYTIHTFLSDGTFVFNGTYGLAIPTFRAPVQSPWTFSITGTSVASFTTGSIISATPRIGTFGSNNEVYVTGVDTSTNSINCFAWAKGPNSIPPSSGLINAIYPTGELTVTSPRISGITTAGAGYKFTISNIKGTLLYSTGTVFTATSITGSLGTGSTAAVFGIDSFTQIQAYTSGGTAPVAGFIGTPTLSASTATLPSSGDIAYVTTGTYSWTAPAGVTSVSVVAVGGGGGGGSTWSSGGGGGGGLGWKNNISVTPGQSYTVVVGQGGPSNANATTAGSEGGTSYFISTATVAGYGGGRGGPGATAASNGYGGGFFGDGGGRGGDGAFDGNWQRGGAGAGGYTGRGAEGVAAGGVSAPDGGGGASGGYYSSTNGVPAGGGVGIYGQGASGVARGQFFGGGGGSGGENGRGGEASGESGFRIINGGAFGGGGGGSGTSVGGGWGGGGAVRIIWGAGRAFPATNAGTLTSVVAVLTTVITVDDNIGGDSTTREALMSISTPVIPRQNTVPTQVLVNVGSSIREKAKNFVHVPTNLTNSTDYEMAPSDTRVINGSNTGTYIYGVNTVNSSSWIFGIYNISSSTVASLSSGTIITINTSSGSTGSPGVGNTVYVHTVTNTTSIIAVATSGTSAVVAGSINSISVPGGTYTNPITLVTSVITTSSAFYGTFNGSNQSLSLAANTAFAFGTGDFTVEAWVYLTVNAGSRLVTTRATGGAASGTWSFSLSPTTMSFTEVISGEPGPGATFASILNQWTHLAACRQSGTTRLFLNGVQVASAAQATNFSNSSYPLYIATSPSENFIGGYVSNLRIVKGTAVYTGNFTPPGSNLTAITNTVLLTLRSSTFIDLSSNALTITPVNSPIITQGSLLLASTATITYSSPFKQVQGVQAAFVAVVPVSSATSYFKNRSFTARLQSPSGLPNNQGVISNVTPSPVSGSSATIYNTTPLTPTVWAFGIYNLSTATVSSLTYGAIITIGQDQGNTGTGNTVYFHTATNNTSIVAVATDGSVGPTNGYITGITVTGGTYIPTSSPTSPTSMEFFIVGGGGGAQGGGGGAGGVSTGTSSVTAEYRYVVQAGAGGAPGQQGTGSAFEQTTVSGGGYGGSISGSNNSGGSGASGGGGGSPANPSYQFQQGGAGAGSGIPGQGNSGGGGGWYSGSASSGGGGGGFTSAGTGGSGSDANGPWIGGNGGAGTTSTFSGSSVTYARGGGGWGWTAVGTPSTAGTPGTGNGGGNYNPGGTGIVMVRYPSSNAPAWSVTGNPTVNVAGGYRIYSWTNTTSNLTTVGSIQFAGPSGYIVPNLGVPGAPGPWTFNLSNMNTTAGFSAGSVITSSALTGSFGSNNTIRVLSITSSTEMICVARSGDISPTVGRVAYIQPTGAIDNGPEISAVTLTSVGTWSFIVSNLTSTITMQPGSVIVATTASGSLASFGTGTIAYVNSVNNISQITAIAMGGTAPVAGVIQAVTTSGTMISFNTGTFATLTFVTGGNLTVTNNGTTDVTIFKTSGSNSWDNEARVAQGFTAPCTLEFFKQAGATDNGGSYAMMGWNDDPTNNASYTSLDYTAYPYQTNAYSVHHNGTEVQLGGTWSTANKFYIVYTVDGYIKHYNGSTLLYSVFYGTGRTVYVDSSFYSVNGTFGGFSNIRVKNAAWNGAYGVGTADYSIVRTGPNVGRQDNWDNIVSNVVVNTLNRPVNYFGNEVTEPKTVVITNSTASIRNAVVPMFELGVTPGNITDITTVTSTTWSFTINGMRSTNGFTTGTIINATSVVGSFGLGNQVTVTGVTSSTALTCITSFGTRIPVAGSITGIYATGEIEPAGPYIEKVVGTNALSNTTSYSVIFNSAFASYLQYPNSTQFNLATAGTPWTAECWIKPTGDYSIYNTIFAKRVTGSGTTSYEGYLRLTTGVISFYNGTNYESGYTLTPNEWSHCAWVYTGSVLNIYVNGVVRYSTSLSLGVDNAEPLVIGQARGYTEYFNGLMSNFRLVKNLVVYTGNFTPPTSPLSTTQTASTNIAAISTGTFTSLLVCQTNTFTDRSVYSTATTVVGTPSISVDNPFGNTATVIGPWSYTISGLTSTNAFFGGAIITATSVVGSIGTGTSYVNFAINNRQIAVINNTVGTTVAPGAITAVSTSGVVTSTSGPAPSYQVEFNASPPTSGGTGKYLTTPSTANYNLGAGGDFTVECWIYLTSNGNNTILTLGTGGSATFWLWQVNSDRSLTWQTNSGSWAWANTYNTSASQIPLNSWTHVAAVRSGSNFNMYINGSSAYSTASFNAGSGASGTLFIGTYYANYNNDGSYFRGNISNLRIVRGTAVYTGNFTVPAAEPGNITNTVLLICRSSTFIDNSTNAVTITPVNSPVISLSTLLLSTAVGAFPASNYTATIVYPLLFGSRVILQGGDVALSTTIKSFDTEQTSGLKANVWSTGTAYGSRHVNWETMTVNSPYSEGQVTGEETGQPFTVYTRDATVNYGKVQWSIPEPMNLVRGQAIATSTVVVGTIATSTYVRSTSTGSINAFRITPTTLFRNTFVPVTTDPGAIGVVETIYGGGPWIFTISGLQSVNGFTTGSIISSMARIGSAGQPGNVTYVTDINTVTNSITCGSYGTNIPTQGIINSVYPTGEFLPQPRITSITTLTGSSWFFNITGIRGTTGLVGSAGSGTVITVTTASGSTSTIGSVSGNSLVVASVDSLEQIKVFAYGGSTPFIGTITGIVTSSTIGSYPIVGDAEFITPGTYTWIAPAGVTSVSAVAVGGGGAGFNSWANAAGAGGGLGWRSSISVTSGTSYTVQVGAGGVKNGGAGGTSFFISTATVAGYGGGNASSGQNTSGPNANGFGGGYVGDGGGAGGNATNQQGGGGAGGYSGTGGNARSLPAAGSGGAAGGGYYSSTYGTGAGGGVGIWGRGATATGWWSGSSGQVFTTNAADGGGGAGGSGGTRGLSGENPTNSVGESGNSDGYGGTFGGGGGGPGTSWPNASGSGGKGGVRIIWGAGRSFPATNAGTFTSVVVLATLTTRSSLIGGPMNFWETQGVITNRMPYPESIGIDRGDTVVITDTITEDAVKIKLFAFNNLSSYNAGSKSITNSLVGSETFFVAGTGTDGATSLSAYWI